MRLTPSADSSRHFLLPLPPGVSADDPDLFGSYSYELRIGHTSASSKLKWWPTASARFGALLRVVGVQHPAPTLVGRAARRRLSRLATGNAAQPAAQQAADAALRQLDQPHIVYGPEMIVATATYATPTLDGTPVPGLTRSRSPNCGSAYMPRRSRSTRARYATSC